MLNRFSTSLTLCLLLSATLASAQGQRGGGAGHGRAESIPSIADRTGGMKKIDGFFPLYWDEAGGQLFMEIPQLNTEVLHSTGFGAGLGSNDIGIDRGGLTGSRIVTFERVGPRVMMVQPNYDFRVEQQRRRGEGGQRCVRAFGAVGVSDCRGKRRRVLVDLTEFLVRDANNIAGRLQPGSYRFEAGRSTIYMPMTSGFPKNTEMEAELTFVRQPGGAGGRRTWRRGARRRRRSSRASAAWRRRAKRRASACTTRSSSCLTRTTSRAPTTRAPGTSACRTTTSRRRSARPLTKRFIARHRLKKVDPRAAVSEAVKPIVYYLDPGTPEPVRSALLEGARWWNQAFEAAGYRNAFQVEMLPEGVSSMDIRYNVINWVHRSTRGWSSGGSVTDPRTGEIIKGVVTLGSLRVRQDCMIAEGLLVPYRTGDETPPEIREWAIARMRQLAAHEVGHTLGLGHNYYDSDAGRITVMDYPHPLVTLRADGTIDYSQVYANGIGEWDKVAIGYGYSDFATAPTKPRRCSRSWTRRGRTTSAT